MSYCWQKFIKEWGEYRVKHHFYKANFSGKIILQKVYSKKCAKFYNQVSEVNVGFNSSEFAPKQKEYRRAQLIPRQFIERIFYLQS